MKPNVPELSCCRRRFPAVPLHGVFVVVLAVISTGAAVLAAPFDLFVTQSPPGPVNQNPATWQGVLQFSVASSGAPLTPASGIDRSAVGDPGGLAFRAASSEVFVGNRHGNNQPSSISRFFYNPGTHALIPNSTVTGNGLYGVHQLAFNPVTGELFAANYAGGVSRFTFDAAWNAIANGTIGSGTTRGVAVSPDGARLYVTTAGAVIRQFDLASGTELTPVTVPGGVGGLHCMRILNGVLYVAAFLDDRVYRYTIGSGNDLTYKDSIAVNDPVSVAFSPDGQEMFVTGHATSDLIYRFQYDAQTDSWVQTAAFDANSSLGDVLVVPSAPALSITRASGDTLVVAWTLPADGWVLEVSDALAGVATTWQQIPPPYQTNGANLQYTESLPLGNKFYRLHKP